MEGSEVSAYPKHDGNLALWTGNEGLLTASPKVSTLYFRCARPSTNKWKVIIIRQKSS
jgi:hypothetical protein